MAPPRIAFYDFDGTLTSDSLVTRYARLAAGIRPARNAVWRLSRLAARAPLLLALEHYSRGRFNQAFFREYRGLDGDWLFQRAERLFGSHIQRSIYPQAAKCLESDRLAGLVLVLVTGELDFIAEAVGRHFGFDQVICNSLIFEHGRATGEVMPPLIAGSQKVAAIERICQTLGIRRCEAKAYSDSYSDAPLLSAVGRPAAVNPDRHLARLARQRGWPILSFRKSAR
ncbi:MAG TPA: HAD-IB family hydrolase [Chloroflexota bacterium]|nr:HAD-IB family hydrolase [Chloroflexota bacterium]